MRQRAGRHVRALALGTLLLASAGASPACANLAGLLRQPQFSHLGLAPIAPALASTVASTYPVASASTSVVYQYNPTLHTLERQTGVAGPIIGERAETIGEGHFNLSLSYSYVHLTSINGDDLDSLLNRRRVNGKYLFFPVPGGTQLADGRLTNILPVRVVADLDVHAHIFGPTVTYGVTPDLDVLATLPVLRTSLDVTAHTQVPDPRFPTYALAPDNPNAQIGSQSASDEEVGVGDLLLRARYVPLRNRWIDVGAQLGLALPTGNRDNFQGTGTTRVLPALILSHIYGRFEPILNAGIDIDANDVGRSVVGWAAGCTAQLLDPLSLSLVFLGRHEVGPLAAPIATPFFFQIERNDQYNASIGGRWRFAKSGYVSLNAIVPLNAQGLQADVIPTFGAEYAF